MKDNKGIVTHLFHRFLLTYPTPYIYDYKRWTRDCQAIPQAILEVMQRSGMAKLFYCGGIAGGPQPLFFIANTLKTGNAIVAKMTPFFKG
jgi:hypothetical protein